MTEQLSMDACMSGLRECLRKQGLICPRLNAVRLDAILICISIN